VQLRALYDYKIAGFKDTHVANIKLLDLINDQLRALALCNENERHEDVNIINTESWARYS
jgi:hypothetical protein